MSKAVLCPVCNGRGTIKDDNGVTTLEKKCHGCYGRGWVTVPEEPVTYKPFTKKTKK